MKKPAIGCFVAGTLVHTKDGLKPIEQIQVGDWVLSRPEDPSQGTENGYKRVTKTFRFEKKQVVRFIWGRTKKDANDRRATTGIVYATPNHPVWSYPHGWVPMGRMFDVNKRIPGTIPRGPESEPWFGRDLVHFDGSLGERDDVEFVYKTHAPNIAIGQPDAYGFATLYDFSGGKYVVGDDFPYDDETWGWAEDETRELYEATVYNIEVEDWHTYFVHELGLWVHNTNCADLALESGFPAA
ncbi:MAG: hypothetical protein C4K60_15190 [Ideonella sp. MAG2]|nr:MAG: hypothetical protein C4K60_15190 [Ideonella sp. MAG2]